MNFSRSMSRTMFLATLAGKVSQSKFLLASIKAAPLRFLDLFFFLQRKSIKRRNFNHGFAREKLWRTCLVGKGSHSVLLKAVDFKVKQESRFNFSNGWILEEESMRPPMDRKPSSLVVGGTTTPPASFLDNVRENSTWLWITSSVASRQQRNSRILAKILFQFNTL